MERRPAGERPVTKRTRMGSGVGTGSKHMD